MSTYLVAVVVSKFTCTAGANITGGVPHQVCSRNDLAADRALANEVGPQLIQILETVTNISYSSMNISKMDQVAIPDFDAGAMENWGLVNYRYANKKITILKQLDKFYCKIMSNDDIVTYIK